MNRTAASSALAMVLLVAGLAIGVAAGIAYSGVSKPAATTLTSIHTTTQYSTVTQTTTFRTSSSGSTGINATSFETALMNTANATLSLRSYEYAKGSLNMWLDNNGSSAIVLCPQMVIYNGTWVPTTILIALDPKITEFGIFYYMPPSSEIIAQVGLLDPPVSGTNVTAQILNNQWNFTYGTVKD